MKVAAVQLNSTGERASNIEAADRHVRAAAADGATLIVLPEKWPLIGGSKALQEGAEPLDGPAVTWARQTASELGIDLIAGSITERREGRERLSNVSLHIGPDGEIKALYRKLHMFDVEIEGRVYRESEVEEPGEEIILSETAAEGASGVPLGLTICYDLRFPELFRILALRGASIVTLPSAFTRPTTRDHWEILVRARAIENQVFMIAANQVGLHPGNHESGGRSMIVDPWGAILAEAPPEPCHIVAELDLERQEEIRAQLPSLANRREDAYRWPVGEGVA
ncbi:MAG TPA: carbon-nitrogen hydrolase family protein [Solirubrobacteraceae bacterium]|jgi:predicted amidohydrolase